MGGYDAGGIGSLAEIIAGHKSEIVADFRAIYSVSVWDVTVIELWHLIQELTKDPTSRLHAVIAGWKYPVTREWMVLADLFDVQLGSKSKRRPMPYPRPFTERSKKIGGKNTVKRSIAEVSALLRPQQ